MLSWEYLFLIEGIVKGKSMVIDVLGDPVNLVLGFVNFDLWVGTGNRVYFSALLFLFEDGPFADTDGELLGTAGTFSWSELVCGDSIFSLNLLFSIISSKSMSVFLPLCSF